MKTKVQREVMRAVRCTQRASRIALILRRMARAADKMGMELKKEIKRARSMQEASQMAKSLKTRVLEQLIVKRAKSTTKSIANTSTSRGALYRLPLTFELNIYGE